VKKKIFLFWLTKDVVGFSWFPNPSVGSEVLCCSVLRKYIATLLLKWAKKSQTFFEIFRAESPFLLTAVERENEAIVAPAVYCPTFRHFSGRERNHKFCFNTGATNNRRRALGQQQQQDNRKLSPSRP
jgi:hypothetical protein